MTADATAIPYLMLDDAETGSRATAIDTGGRVYELLVIDVGLCDGDVGVIDVEVFAQGCAWRGSIACNGEDAVLTVPEFGDEWAHDLRTFIVGGAR